MRARFERLAGESLRDDRGILRLNCDGLEGRLAPLEHFTTAGQGATGAHGRDQNINLALGVFPNLLRRSLPMDVGVGGVVELLRDPGARSIFRQLLGFGDGPFHPFSARRQDQLGPEHCQQRTALERHCLGHGENDLVALGGRHESQRYAGIAARRLNDNGVLLEYPPLLRIFNHGHADAVLHTAERIKELALEQNGGWHPVRDLVQAHQRRMTDRFDDIVVYSTHRVSSRVTEPDVQILCARQCSPNAVREQVEKT